MRKGNFIILVFIVFIFTLNGTNAEKDPVWQWASTAPVNDVDISDDSINISASHGLKFSLWYNDSSTPETTNGVGGGVSSMDMSSSGKYVITGEMDDLTLTFWEEGSRKWEKNNFLIELRDIDFSSSGSNITAVDVYNVYFIQKASKDVIWVKNHPTTELSSVAMSPDGKFIAAGTVDGTVFVYSTSNSSNVWQHSYAIDNDIIEIEFSGDSSHLIIGTASGRVYVYQTDSTFVFSYTQPTSINCVSAGPRSDYYLFGNTDGELFLLSKAGSKIWQKSLDGGLDSKVVDCTFNGNGHYVLAGSDNSRLVLLVNTTTGEVLWEEIAFGEVTSVSMSYRGSNIVVGTKDGLALYYEELLDNQAPIVSIESITPSISLPGTLITMNGSAIDSDGSVVDYLWSSSLDGNLSSDKNFTISNLTQGLHTISFMAQDDEGKWSGPITMIIGVGDFPDASIDSVTGCDFTVDCIISEGTEITFMGSAVSTVSEETEIESYEWKSSLDNVSLLSSKSSFNISSLSRGLHTITFRAVNTNGFWSANVTVSLLINGIPQSSILSITPNFITPGEDVKLTAQASDPEEKPLKYIWTSPTLFFANGQNIYENQVPYSLPINVSKILTTVNDVGSHSVFLRVQDSYGAYSENSTFTINILSPPLILAQCDESGMVGDNLLFSTMASDRDGIILLYEWDFDSQSGDIDSVDFEGAAFTTHTYNKTTPNLEYLVVVRVTDNDGLVSRDTCQVLIEEKVIETSSADTSSENFLGSITEIASPPVLLGLGLIILVIGGVAIYMLKREDEYYSESFSLSSSVRGSDFMSSVVPEVSPVKERRIQERRVITETTVVECPECSAQIDVPNFSGMQSLQCPDCGLEGEIEL